MPCGPINTVDAGSPSPSGSACDPVVGGGGGGRGAHVRYPIGLSGTRPRYRLPPPGLDEHGDELRRWLAG